MVFPINSQEKAKPVNTVLKEYSASEYTTQVNEPLTDFDSEDQAIISAEAKLLNELDKFNSGQGDEIDLAMTSIMSKNQVEAAATVIKTKKEMMDNILSIVD